MDDLGKVSADTRNPYLAGALEIMIDTENRFSGIPTVLAELKKADMPTPIFIDKRGAFKVIFYKKEVIQSKDSDLEQWPDIFFILRDNYSKFMGINLLTMIKIYRMQKA